MHISVADFVYIEIESRMKKEKKTNRSEYVEELLRIGLSHTPKT